MPITLGTIPERVKKELRRVYDRRDFRISFGQFLSLYVWAYNRAEELGWPDPETFVFESLDHVDPLGTFEELKADLEMRGIRELGPPPELEELEYYKERVKELEKEIARLEKIVPIEEIEKLRREVKKYKELAEKRMKEIERMRERRPVGITREELKELLKPVGEALKGLLERVRAVEERVVAPPIEIPPAPIVRMPMVETEEKPVIDLRKLGPEIKALAWEYYGKKPHELTNEEAKRVYEDALEILKERAYTKRAPMVESALKNVMYMDRGRVKFLFPETENYWDPVRRAENYPKTEWPHIRLYKYLVVKKLISRDDLVSLGIPEEWIDKQLAKAKRDLEEMGIAEEML